MATHSSFSITYICTAATPYRSPHFYAATQNAVRVANYGTTVIVKIQHGGKDGEPCPHCGVAVKR